jgi:hypothetical protein
MRAVPRVWRASAVVALAVLAAGCGGSHTTAPTTTTPVNTVPQPTLELVVKNFPAELAGSLTFKIDSTQGNPKKPGGWRRRYTVALDHIVLRLTGVQGKGDKRQAGYKLVSAQETFSGFEDLTNSKCKTTHIVWDGSGKRPTGTVAIYGPKFDASVGFAFLVPQRGATTTRPCSSSSGGVHSTVTRTARIAGNANLRLATEKNPLGRFSIGIEIQSSTAGQSRNGGYTITGLLAPAGAEAPVQLCRESGTKLTCPA